MALKLYYPRNVFAVWNTDANERRFCASAGIGTLLARYVVAKRQGISLGSRYETDGFVRVAVAVDSEGVKQFSGSKYVQSIISREQYDTIVSYLASGRWVLFVGTPCQVAAIKAYVVKRQSCDINRLVTVDIICHGTCPPEYLHEEIMHLKQKYKLSDITDVRFRSNDENDYCLTLWNQGKLLLRQHYSISYYLKGFLDGITLRECCYSCPFAKPERSGDITIGDYVGLDANIAADHANDGNTSAVFVNTPKGEALFDEILNNYPELVAIERSYDERLALAPPLRIPSPRDPRQQQFMNHYRRVGYIKAIRRTIWREVFIARHRWLLLPHRIVSKLKRRLHWK